MPGIDSDDDTEDEKGRECECKECDDEDGNEEEIEERFQAALKELRPPNNNCNWKKFTRIY